MVVATIKYVRDTLSLLGDVGGGTRLDLREGVGSLVRGGEYRVVCAQCIRMRGRMRLWDADES